MISNPLIHKLVEEYDHAECWFPTITVCLNCKGEGGNDDGPCEYCSDKLEWRGKSKAVRRFTVRQFPRLAVGA